MEQITENISVKRSRSFLNKYTECFAPNIIRLAPNTIFISKNKIVQLRINYGEVDLVRRVKSMGENGIREKGLGTCLRLCPGIRISKTYCGLKHENLSL